MEQKHAMMYPPLDPNAVSYAQRASASASVGLPIEAPPSYDMAMEGSVTPAPAGGNSVTNNNAIGWAGSNPAASSPSSQPEQTSYGPVIVEQPQSQSQGESQSTDRTVTVGTAHLGPHPSAVTCPVCGTCQTTKMIYTPNNRTHLCAFILCLVGWCCCACCVPYCMQSCKTGNHYCGKCNAYLGSYHPHHRRWR